MTKVKIVAGCRCESQYRYIDMKRLRSAEDETLLTGWRPELNVSRVKATETFKAVGKTFRTLGPFQMTEING